MASSRIRINALARIRARQAKLNPNERINILRGLSTRELKQVEKSLNAKISLSKAGVDTSSIGIVDTKTALSLAQVGRSIKAESSVTLAKAANQLARANKAQLISINKKLKEVEGFGNVDFIRESINRKINPKSKLLKADSQTLVKAIFDPNFVESTVKKLVDQTNNALKLQGLDDKQIVFDEFDLDSSIAALNKVAQRTKNIARYVEFDEDIIDEDFTF